MLGLERAAVAQARGRLSGPPPQPGGLEHVGLVDGRHPGASLATRGPRRLASSPRPGGLERRAGDALDLPARVRARVVGLPVAAPAISEVDPSGELANDEQVGSPDPLLAQGAGMGEGGAGTDRTQVGVQAEALAQAEQSLLGPGGVGVGALPLRAAHGAEQHRVGLGAGGEHLVRERGPVLVDARAADELIGDLELADRVEEPARRRLPHWTSTGYASPYSSPSFSAKAIVARPYPGRRADTLRRTYSRSVGSGMRSITSATKRSRSDSGSRLR